MKKFLAKRVSRNLYYWMSKGLVPSLLPKIVCIVTVYQLQGAHLLEQMNNKLKQAAARNVVNAMDFFLPMISSRINIHMVPGGKGNE